MSALLSEIIDSVGTNEFSDIDDLLKAGSAYIVNKKGQNFAVIKGGVGKTVTNGAGASLSTSVGQSAIKNGTVVSSVSSTGTGLLSKAVGILGTVATAKLAYDISYSLGLKLGEQYLESEIGRAFLLDYYNLLTNSDMSLDDFNNGILIDGDGVTYVDYRDVENGFNLMNEYNLFAKDGIEIPQYNEKSLTYQDFLPFAMRYELLLEAVNQFNAATGGAYAPQAQNLAIKMNPILANPYGSFTNPVETDYSFISIKFTLTDSRLTLQYDVNQDIVINVNSKIRLDDNGLYVADFTYNNSYLSANCYVTLDDSEYSPISLITYDKNDSKKYKNVTDFTLSTNTESNGTLNVITTSIANVTKGIEGVDELEDAVLPDTSISLRENYPNWFERTITLEKVNGETIELLPLKLYDTETPTQTDSVSGLTSQPIIDVAIDNGVVAGQDNGLDTPSNNPSTNTGNTSAVVEPPSIDNIGFISMYQPIASELQSFNNWLWSLDPTTLIFKLFQNPMDAIIGLHMIYAPTPTVEVGNIIVGLLDTNITSRIVTEQYVTLDCGDVTINEYYGDKLDYSPYTTITMFLPFIGFVNLSVEDVMQSIINLKYNIDLLTGSCVALVTVKKNNMEAVLYSYNGNCSVQLPISGANYSSLLTTLVSAGVAVATRGASTASVPLTTSLVGNAITNAHVGITHGSGITSNYGAMNIKKPYIIINRFNDVTPEDYEIYQGFGSSKTIKLSKLQGYTRVKDVHIDDISNATDIEKDMIKQYLLGGIIL